MSSLLGIRWFTEIQQQKLINAMRIHYNFIREPGSIKKTPAEQAGINPDLGQNKIENLIKLSAKSKTLV
jgi:hypothetical protein